MNALEGELRRYTKPHYDGDYIPPAYVISYQLGHVYMVWKALSWTADVLEQWSWQPLRIIDFGSGTSAGRIGATLMVATAIEEGHIIDHVYYDEIDISVPMQAMGELVWQAFIRRVQREYTNTALNCAVNAIEPRQHRGWEKVKGDGRETWLTAFHVINRDSYLLPVIKSLCREVKPIAGVFSCNKGNMDKMREIFPFTLMDEWNSGYYPKHEGKIDSKVKCETYYTIWKALYFGFRQSHQRDWRPFLQVKDCAILFGDR